MLDVGYTRPMAIDILGDLVIGAVGDGLRLAVEGKILRWRRNAFFEKAAKVDAFGELEAERQKAFLEVVAAAALDDGVLSDSEKAWLGARRDATKEPTAIDAALEATTAALGSPIAADKLTAFVEERSALLADEETREAALAVVGVVLHEAGRASYPDVIRAFGSALGLKEKAIANAIEMVQDAPKS